MELLNQLLYNLSEVGLILSGQHANEVYLELSQVFVVEINVLYLSYVDVFVLVYKLCVKVLEDGLEPSHNDFSCDSFVPGANPREVLGRPGFIL